MLDKLMAAQAKALEIKDRLDSIEVSGEAENGKIRVTATGNKKITSVKIDPEFAAEADNEALEDLLLIAINRALDQAENVSQSETQAMTREMFGGMF